MHPSDSQGSVEDGFVYKGAYAHGYNGLLSEIQEMVAGIETEEWDLEAVLDTIKNMEPRMV